MPRNITPTKTLTAARIKKVAERNKGAGVTGTTKHLAYASAFAELCLALNDSEYTKPQLVKLTGLTMNTVVKWVNALKRRKLIYIVDYTNPARGCKAAIYTWGYMKRDVPRPKPLSKSEYSANYQKRKLEREALHGILK